MKELNAIMSIFNKNISNIFSAEYEPEPFDKVISLGGTCQVAHQLNRLGLRFESYPFDWLFSTDPDKLTEAISNDFRDWLEYDNLKEEKTTTAHKRIVDSRYNMIHQHIFPLDIPLSESYKDTKAIADRRVKRLLDLKNSGKRILFIRTNLTADEACRLGSVIRQKYGKNAVLLVVNHSREFRINRIGIKSKNVYMYEIYDENENTGQRWQGYDPHWDRLLRDIRVKSKSADMGDDSLFERFYPCERGGDGKKFRWSKENSVLHLEKYGGCKCHIEFASPVAVGLKITDAHSNIVFRTDNMNSAVFETEINHETRFLTLITDKVWRPCEVTESSDSRELGVRVNSVKIEIMPNDIAK